MTRRTLPSGETYDDRRPVGPKETGPRNYAEVLRLRAELAQAAKHGELSVEAATALADERRELERARARAEALQRELNAARAEEFEGTAGDSVGGKPAVAKFRRETWARFASAVVRLPLTRERTGMAGVRLAVAKALLPDLYLLGLTPPRGAFEAAERDRLRRVLDTPSLVAVLARPEPWADRLRVLFLSQVARSFFRPSVWTVYETAAGELARDRWGEVIK